MNKYFGTTGLDLLPDELFIDLTGVDRNGNPVDHTTSGLRNFAKSLTSGSEAQFLNLVIP